MTDISYLNDMQIRALLNAARVNRRDYLMLLLTYQLGLRAMEVCPMQAGQFDTTTDKVFLTVARLKGSKKTRHELAPETAALCREYIAGMGPNEYLFKGNRRTAGSHIGYTTFYHAFLKYAKKAGIPLDIASPHILKHSAAMGMLPNGVKMVQEHLGHKSGNSSMMYLSVKRSEVDAAAHRSLVGAVGASA